MPTYLYKRTDSGEIVSVTMPISVMERRQREAMDKTGVEAGILLGEDDGVDVDDPVLGVRDFAAEAGGFHSVAQRNWPQFSDAAGCGSHEINEHRAHSQKIGVPTDFTRDGRAIFTSRKHRRDYCRAIGLRDKHGGYGDP